MHATLLASRLDGLGRQVASAMASVGPTSQTGLMARLPGISQPTLSRVIARLVAQGLVEKSGVTKGAEFRLIPAVAHFMKPAHLRPSVPYDSSRIDGYVPNVTRWLPPQSAARMRDAAGKVAHRLDASTYSRRIAERFLIDLSWASSHLEGNTYEYLEAEALIKFSEKAEGHDWTEVTMILNHKRAIALLLDAVEGRDITPGWLSRLHSLLMRDLLDPADLGRVRLSGSDIRIGGSSYRPATDNGRISMDLGALCWAAEETEDPFEASFLLLVGMAYLQTYADGNKRMGRLSCNLPLLRASLPPMSFLGVTPSEYISAIIAFYELGDAEPLADVVCRGYELSTPHYSAAVATQRAPRSAEIRHRKRINEAVAALMQASVDGRPDQVGRWTEANMADIPFEDRAVLASSIQSVLDVIGPANFDAWEVQADLAEAFAEQRENASGSSGPKS